MRLLCIVACAGAIRATPCHAGSLLKVTGQFQWSSEGKSPVQGKTTCWLKPQTSDFFCLRVEHGTTVFAVVTEGIGTEMTTRYWDNGRPPLLRHYDENVLGYPVTAMTVVGAMYNVELNRQVANEENSVLRQETLPGGMHRTDIEYFRAWRTGEEAGPLRQVVSWVEGYRGIEEFQASAVDVSTGERRISDSRKMRFEGAAPSGVPDRSLASSQSIQGGYEVEAISESVDPDTLDTREAAIAEATRGLDPVPSGTPRWYFSSAGQAYLEAADRKRRGLPEPGPWEPIASATKSHPVGTLAVTAAILASLSMIIGWWRRRARSA